MTRAFRRVVPAGGMLSSAAARVTRWSTPTRYGVAVAAAAVAVLLRIGLEPLWGDKLRLLTFYPAIMVSAWLGGFWPGMITTLLCAAATAYVWMLPIFSLAPIDVGNLVALVLFTAIGLVISGLNEAWRRATASVGEAAQELRVTLASIGDAVITTDDAGCVVLLNPVAEALTGWSGAEAAGKLLDEVFVIVNEQSREPAENPVGRVLREGRITGLANHTVLLSRDGREIPIDDSAAPIRTADGRVTGVVMVFRDISDRKRAERRQALQHAVTVVLAEAADLPAAAPEILRLIGEGLGWDMAALWTADREAILLRCAELWHRPAAKLEDFVAHTRGRTFAPGVGLPGRVWTTGEPVWLSNAGDEAEFLRASTAVSDGVHAALFVPILAGAQVTGVLEILSQDLRRADPDVIVTMSSLASRIGHFLERQRTDAERRRVLAEAQEARREAERANRAKDEFLAMLSHDLRAPLTAGLGWLNMMRRGQLDTEHQQRAVAVIERSLWSLARMIDDLLDISRIAAGKLTLVRRSLSLGPLVAEVVESVQPEGRVKDVTVEARLDPAAADVLADPDRMRQVVTNLVGNAVKFTPPGGRVSVRLDAGPGTATITVQDTGIGIAPDQLPHVFERFRQADRPAAIEGGLGLGLAIAREIVMMHGGTVEARSGGPGRGAAFIVALPLAPTAVKDPVGAS